MRLTQRGVNCRQLLIQQNIIYRRFIRKLVPIYVLSEPRQFFFLHFFLGKQSLNIQQNNQTKPFQNNSFVLKMTLNYVKTHTDSEALRLWKYHDTINNPLLSWEQNLYVFVTIKDNTSFKSICNICSHCRDDWALLNMPAPYFEFACACSTFTVGTLPGVWIVLCHQVCSTRDEAFTALPSSLLFTLRRDKWLVSVPPENNVTAFTVCPCLLSLLLPAFFAVFLL